MPDRLPPSWGHGPEDGRDLDALLSGQAPLSVEEILTDEAVLAGQLAGISDSQRPVAGAMFALRAAPAESELAGEAAARAAFRALMTPPAPGLAAAVPSGARPSGTVPPCPAPAIRGAAAMRGDSCGAEPHRTLVLQVPAAGQGPRPPARHRRSRHAAAGRGGWRVMALLGSAAAVVAVGAAALAGTFSGSAGHGGQSASTSDARRPAGPGASPTGTRQDVLGNGAKETAPSATRKASAAPGANRGPDASDLCREFFGFSQQAGRATRREVIRELSRLAGTDSTAGIVHYCVEQLGPHLFTKPTSQSGGWPWFHDPGWPGSGGGNGRPDAGAGPGNGGSGQASRGPGPVGPAAGGGGSR